MDLQPRVATLALVQPAANQTFAIGPGAQMPAITAEARISGVSPDPTPTTQFRWTVRITFNCASCTNGPQRTINPPPITQTTVGTPLQIPFPSVRGGELSIQVQATVNGTTLTAQSQGLRIVGTNPPLALLAAAVPNETLRRIIRHESACRQFNAAAGTGTARCPLWSGDRLGGVGLMQITRPTPTDDQVWSWKANVRAGRATLRDKVRIARAYPATVRRSQRFVDMVAAYNQTRAGQGLPPVTVDVPAFTSSGWGVPSSQLGQVELDAVRGFNGWAGRDAFGTRFSDRPATIRRRNVLHEFRVALDAAGRLIVDLPPGSTTGTIRWERVPAAARPQGVGDPNYVNNVLRSNPC
jgi:hypothetical protein